MLATVTAADVLQVRVILLTVVVSPVLPITEQRDVPVALFSPSLTSGNTVPAFWLLLIQMMNVMVEPAGITPLAFGTPVCVSNSLITYSPAALFVREDDDKEMLFASGPAVSSLSNVVLIVEASLCRWYVAVCPVANIDKNNTLIAICKARHLVRIRILHAAKYI